MLTVKIKRRNMSIIGDIVTIAGLGDEILLNIIKSRVLFHKPTFEHIEDNFWKTDTGIYCTEKVMNRFMSYVNSISK